ncbi:MAG: TetR/AcrR family transcriptional regulator [Caulobacterales bacterium]
MSGLKAHTKGERTRTALLNLAETAILEKGYAATSIEELVAAAGVTKSGFFYHFADKVDLAKALLRRDSAAIETGLTEIFEAAAAAHADPLDALLEGLAQSAFAAAASPSSRPGCLSAALSYQDALMDDELRALVREGLGFRRRIYRAQLEKVAETYPPRATVDLDALADMAIAVSQGAIIVGRVHESADFVHAQIALYRAYLRGVFVGLAR